MSGCLPLEISHAIVILFICMPKNKIRLLALILICILFLLSSSTILAQISGIIIIWPKPGTARPVLQLNTFNFITLAPKPSVAITPAISPNISGQPYCQPDSLKKPTCKCPEYEFEGIACPPTGIMCPTPYVRMGFISPPGSTYCVNFVTPPPPPPLPAGCAYACVGKPVVYLYPTKPTLVSVALEVPGSIIASDPLYPDGGWKDVLAHPDGTLIYKGKKYRELFYETSVTQKIATPKEGMVIPSDKLEQTLRPSIAQLGLIQKEQDEFLEYWVPVLRNLHSPYILFSVLPSDIKESVDHLVISPKPDTRIEFIAYFKPLNKPVSILSLRLPQAPPVRTGFTEVEWGGTIDYN